MNFSAVRSALKDAIATIEGLNVDDLRDEPNVPCVIVVPDTPFNMDTDFDDGQAPLFKLVVLLPYTNTQNSQDQLDAFLSTEGPQSIKVAVESDARLKTVCSSAVVTELRAYGITQMRDGGVQYLSGELIVELYA